MLNNFYSNPFFWIGLYSSGYIIIAIVFTSSRILTNVKNRIPKLFIRAFILPTFIAPIIALPFTKGPQLAVPAAIALFIGAVLLGASFTVRILAQKQIGKFPALKAKEKLITTGIYGIIRNPMYASNGLLALGMAVLFKSTYAALFSIPYTLLFLPIIYFEEKDLLDKYGKEFEEYKKKVPWRLIPWMF